MSENRYTAIITGNAPPYKWEVKLNQKSPNAGKDPETGAAVPLSGQADSFEDAFSDARWAAERAEALRTHALTVRTVELFTTSDDPLDAKKVQEQIDAAEVVAPKLAAFPFSFPYPILP